MRKTIGSTLVAAALGAFALAGAPREAKAQEIQITGPLAGAPAVRKLRLYREGRFEFSPGVSFTLLDEYRRTIIPGATLQYNLFEWLGLGVWGGYGVVSLTTDLTDQIDSTALRNSRTAPNLNHQGNAEPFKTAPFGDQTAKLTYFIAPQAQFVPLRGKLALFQKLFVDTDAYLHGGVMLVGVEERGNCGVDKSTPSCTDPKSFTRESRLAVAPTFGLGLSFYTSKIVSLRMEYRAFPFSWNRAGFDQRGGGTDGKFPNGITGNFKVDSEDRTFKFNQMFTVQAVISFPKPNVSE
ncbi:MAG: hypothetical protein JNL38_34890 [Myxococcales bacterium]|jgi:outer membrane beta-barrel protein|nr:hypothetical protein [Myxococcales bacterium]